MKRIYTPREFMCILSENGYTRLRTRGSHIIYGNGIRHITITARELNPMVARRLIKEYNLRCG